MANRGLHYFSSRYGDKLAARYDPPFGPRRALAIFAHCFTCSKDMIAAKAIAEGLASQGIGVLRFDFTGLGHSQGEFGNSGFAGNVADIIAAARWLGQTTGEATLLVGHSFGGAAALAAAAQLPHIRGVATIGAPASPAHVTRLFKQSREEIEVDGSAEVTIAGRSFRICKSFVADIESQMQADVLGHLRKDVLILHAPLDEIVGIDNAASLFQALKHPKSFLSLDKADHLLSRRKDAEFAASVIAAWASRLIEESHPDAGEEGNVVVRPTGDGLFAHIATAGRHAVRADEPKSAGGKDSGFTPYDLLLAGLGACTSMTIRMYAQRKQWPLENVSVVLKHEKRYISDCQGCEEKPHKVDYIARDILIEGPLDAAQRERLMEIADKCPVHRTLEGEIRIETRES